MRLKISILTILMIGLLAFSVYLVFEDNKAEEELAQSLPFVKSSQAAYVLPVLETNYLPLRNWNMLEPDIKAKAAIVYDTQSGKALFQKNLRTILPIASITKLLTAMVVSENIEPSEKIFITDRSVSVDNASDFYIDEVFYAEDLIKFMLIESSNDAAYAFKNAFEERGIDLISLMNKKAEEIRMINSNFQDPSGLTEENRSTVEDVVKLVNEAFIVPLIRDSLMMKTGVISSADGRFSHQMRSTNQLLGVIEDIEIGKTGYTDEALGTMAIRVGVDGSSLVAVVLGSTDRFGEIKNLINWAKKAHTWK